jgi:hypothetical protein
MKKDKSKLLEALRAVRDEIYASIRLQLSDENLTYQQIADAHGISLATVKRVAERSGISRQVGPRPRPKGTGALRNKFAQLADAPIEEGDDAPASVLRHAECRLSQKGQTAKNSADRKCRGLSLVES